MSEPSQGHYGFHSFQVVDLFCLFIDRLAEVLFLMVRMYAWYWLNRITTAVLRDRLGDHVFQPKSYGFHSFQVVDLFCLFI
jgi:hypothetical protein